MSPWLLMGLAWAIAAVCFAALWWWCQRRADASWVDPAWSLGVGLASVGYAVWSEGDPARRALVAAMAGLWSLRLTIHLLQRLATHEGEDKRYARMRAASGSKAGLVFFLFFQIQAFWVVLLSAPMMGALSADRQGLGWPEALAVAIWLVALSGETWSDLVLERFRRARQPVAQVCRRGPWAWSRHPNYFFEWLFWWSFVCIGVADPALGGLTLVGPFAVLVLVFTVTGILPAELSSLRSRGEAFVQYQKEVSVWMPLPPSRTA